MDVRHKRKEQLREATRKACAQFTKGMKKPELEKRLEDVKSKIEASTDRQGRPMKGFAERVAACREEIARLESLIG